MDKQTTCCFTGHRTVAVADREALKANLAETIESLYRRGYRDFITGGAVGFDTSVAMMLLEYRKTHDIRLHIFVPCADQDKYFSDAMKKLYKEINDSADEVLVLQPSYTDDCMLKRNRKMVDCSSVCVSYLRRQRSGTSSTVAYAKRTGAEVIAL